MTDKILFKKLDPNVKLPKRNGAGYDLYLPQSVDIEPGETVRIHLGFACKLPAGLFAVIAMRSSTWGRWGVQLTNGIGIVDGDYCGEKDEWQLSVWLPPENSAYPKTIPEGTRIAQFVLLPNLADIGFEIVDHLHPDSRGGFGSTGE